MTDIPTAAQIAAFLEDDANVEALTDAVQELNNIFINGTADRPPRGILPIEPLQTMTTGHYRMIPSPYNSQFGSITALIVNDAPMFGPHYKGGIDLGEGQSFTPTEE